MYFFPVTDRMWATLHILWKAVWSFLWPTGSEWHCTFCETSLIICFPMTNRKWVTLHILWKAIWSHVFLWPTASEWHCTFCETSLITCFPMTNRKWVTLHILWKAVWSHLFQWPTGSEWHQCTFCERQSDHIFSYDQQLVSDIAHFLKGSLITSFPSIKFCPCSIETMKGHLQERYFVLFYGVVHHLCHCKSLLIARP